MKAVSIQTLFYSRNWTFGMPNVWGPIIAETPLKFQSWFYAMDVQSCLLWVLLLILFVCRRLLLLQPILLNWRHCEVCIVQWCAFADLDLVYYRVCFNFSSPEFVDSLINCVIQGEYWYRRKVSEFCDIILCFLWVENCRLLVSYERENVKLHWRILNAKRAYNRVQRMQTAMYVTPFVLLGARSHLARRSNFAQSKRIFKWVAIYQH